jgi:hypothetical protein
VWRRWANIHFSTRKGVGFGEFNATQSTAALNLLHASLSAKGVATSLDIMKPEGHLADLMNDHNQYGEQRYWLTIIGEPSEVEPWGWQLDGPKSTTRDHVHTVVRTPNGNDYGKDLLRQLLVQHPHSAVEG